MPPFLDYATPQRHRMDVVSKAIATLPLVLGLVIYALLCEPAATQRGYPPIDPLWEGVTYLWLFPVPLFVLCWPGSRFSLSSLLLYGIISGYIDACTVVEMVPHRFSAIGALFNSILFVPLHILGVGIMAAISRFAICKIGPIVEKKTTAAKTALRVCVFVAIVLVGAVFPTVYRRFAFHRMAVGGRERADADWAAHSAVIMLPWAWFVEHPYGDATMTSFFDEASGLPLRGEMRMGYEPSYEKRVRELLQLNGNPPWSQKSRFVSDADMVAVFSDQTMTPVTTFPFDAATGITLLRNCSTSRWGGIESSGSNDLCIDSKLSGMGGPGGTGTVYVGRQKKYPEILFVRCGKSVAACTDDGWILGYATHDLP